MYPEIVYGVDLELFNGIERSFVIRGTDQEITNIRNHDKVAYVRLTRFGLAKDYPWPSNMASELMDALDTFSS